MTTTSNEQPDENGLIFGELPAVREFQVWLNSKRMCDVSLVFHEIVAKYRTAITHQVNVMPPTRGTGGKHNANGAADDQRIFDLAAKHESRTKELFGPITFSSTAIVDFVRDVSDELACRFRAQGGITNIESASHIAATDQPSAGLTDERIDAIARDHNLDGSMLNKPRHAYWRMFAHAIEREARASLTPTAPAPQRPSDDDLWDQTLRDRDTYHDWADKLADAIAKHFGADIGEHSNMNCPWAEALEVIECATPTAPQAASQQGEAGPASEQVMIELMRKALEDIAQPADVGCGCSFPCRCNDDGAEAVNARAMRGIASDTLSEVERLCRAQRLASQRARIKARFANRPRTPATADFDLPAPNDVVCDHAWPEADGQADINGHCEMCGLTFQRYIHGDNFNEGAPQAATTASTSGDCSTCNGNREREVSEFKTVPCPDCAQAPSQPASASGEPSSIWRIRHPDGCTTYQDTEPADYLRPYATAYRAQAPSREAARLPTLPGCLADRLYEAISIARNRAEHAGSTPRIAKWDATAADLRAALARAPLPAQNDEDAE